MRVNPQSAVIPFTRPFAAADTLGQSFDQYLSDLAGAAHPSGQAYAFGAPGLFGQAAGVARQAVGFQSQAVSEQAAKTLKTAYSASAPTAFVLWPKGNTPGAQTGASNLSEAFVARQVSKAATSATPSEQPRSSTPQDSVSGPADQADVGAHTAASVTSMAVASSGQVGSKSLTDPKSEQTAADQSAPSTSSHPAAAPQAQPEQGASAAASSPATPAVPEPASEPGQATVAPIGSSAVLSVRSVGQAQATVNNSVQAPSQTEETQPPQQPAVSAPVQAGPAVSARAASGQAVQAQLAASAPAAVFNPAASTPAPIQAPSNNLPAPTKDNQPGQSASAANLPEPKLRRDPAATLSPSQGVNVTVSEQASGMEVTMAASGLKPHEQLEIKTITRKLLAEHGRALSALRINGAIADDA